MRNHSAQKQGFSLVELSIVLVILGLLVGGVLTGQSLIRAAELRSITVDFQRYQAAIETFRGKYFALPGDMRNATDFWGAAHATPSNCRTTISTGEETCNGDGSGRVSEDVAGVSHESKRFWQHLSNAGLIEGRFSGVARDATLGHGCIIGTSCPALKLSNATMDFMYSNGHSGSTTYFDHTASHIILLGNTTLSSGSTGDRPLGAIVTAQEAWNIDKKIDDGLPAQGKLMNRVKPSTTASFLQDTITCTTNDDASLAEYSLSNSDTNCALTFFYR